MSTPLDKVGYEIHAGDYIVYGHALGRCASLRIGRVLRVTEKEPDHRGEPKHHFTVLSIDDDQGGQLAKLCAKKGTLQFAERIMVVAAETLPNYYVVLLRNPPELVTVTCQDCREIRSDVHETICPYSQEINEKLVEIRVCRACYQKRAEDI